jgi:hypothetical protein
VQRFRLGLRQLTVQEQVLGRGDQIDREAGTDPRASTAMVRADPAGRSRATIPSKLIERLAG